LRHHLLQRPEHPRCGVTVWTRIEVAPGGMT
jgi:hypothetical protein